MGCHYGVEYIRSTCGVLILCTAPASCEELASSANRYTLFPAHVSICITFAQFSARLVAVLGGREGHFVIFEIRFKEVAVFSSQTGNQGARLCVHPFKN